MSGVRELSLIFFVTFLSLLKPKACAAKIEFWTGFFFFFKNLSFKVGMSWLAGIGSPEVYLFIDLLKNPSKMPLSIVLVTMGNCESI